MKLNGEISFWLRKGSMCDELFMYVSYKHPRKLFKRSLKVLLSTTWSDKFDTNEEFLKDCLVWMNAEYALGEVAKENMIKDYYEVNKKSPRDNLNKDLAVAIKSINKKGLSIEVEVDK
jgi:hypothetical protein